MIRLQRINSTIPKTKTKEIINHAYELAHYNEIADLFENLVSNDWFDDIVIDNLINYQGNILVKLSVMDALYSF